MRGVALLVALVGCDAAFDLEHITPIDAPATTDEDGDGVYAGDNCPAIVNPDQLDDDLDQIGNACDPHLGEYDVVVDQTLFRGAPSNWLASGPWTMTEGAWQSPDATIGGSMSLPPRTLYRPALQIGFTMDAFDPAMQLRQIELHFDAPTQGDCVARNDPTISTLSQLVIHVDGLPLVSKRIIPDYALGTHYVLTYVRGKTTTCTISGQTGTRDDIADVFSTSPTVTLFRMQATIDHVTLYQVMQ